MSGAISDIIDIVVRASNPGVTRAGFGVPLIVSQNASWVEVTRLYSSLADVQADFSSSTPEYNAARQIFSQTPAPRLLRIGRASTNKALQRWNVAVASASANRDYKVNVWLADGTKLTATYSSVSGSGNGTVIGDSTRIVILPNPASTGVTHLSIDQGADQIWTWSGTRGTLANNGAGAFAGTNGVFVVRANEDPTTDQTITMTAASDTIEKAIIQINSQALYLTALKGGAAAFSMESLRYGDGSNVRVVSGDAGTLADLGLAAGLGTAGTAHCQKTGGTGNKVVSVQFFDDATPAEVVAAIALADGVTGATLFVNDDGLLQLMTDTAGPTPNGVQRKTSTVTLGFDAIEHNGETTGGATNDDIVTGLKTAIDALAGLPAITTSLIGSVGSKTLRAVANATTVWFAIDIDDPTLLTCVQDHAAPAGLADDLTAIANSTSDFYGIVTLYNSTAYVAATAAWAETVTKQYVPAIAETKSATTSYSGGTDELKALKALAYNRTAGFFHPRAAEFADAAEMGRFFPIDPGGDNWRLKTLTGVSSGWSNGAQYTSTQAQNLIDRSANFYYLLAGVDVIGGSGAEASGRYIDVERGLDWYVARLGERLANLLIQNEKVPFTNEGITLVEAQIRSQNEEGISVGLINPGDPPEIPAPVVTVPRAGAVDPALRAARILPDCNTSWFLAGAINKIRVNVAVQQ
jgi:hypothetical protein